MFNPSPFAATPNLCSACWESATHQRDKRMVVEAVDNEEWDQGNQEGSGRPEEYFGDAEAEAAEEAEEFEAKVGDNYELDEGDAAAEDGDWNNLWYDQAGELHQDLDDDNDVYENEGDDPEEEVDAPGDDWTDPDFPPEDQSVGNKQFGCNGWTRLHFLHDQACICKIVGPEDVIGGDDSGNKWFRSACACIAEYPAWVQSMFGIEKPDKLPGDHKYSVRLYHPGKKSFVSVEVDDFVPTRDGVPIFSAIGVQGEIWCPLIEKAFAKLCKSYKEMAHCSVAYSLLYLCGGGGAESWTRKSNGWARSFTKWKGEALDTITRKKAEGVVFDGIVIGQATLWLMLVQYMELCYPVCVTADRAKARKAGLSADRAYSVIGTQEVNMGDRGCLRLVRIRNSWGSQDGMWKGRWSDDSHAWVDCPAAFNACKFKRTDGRTFWMSYNDFLKHFEMVDCVKKSMPIQGCKYSKLEGLKAGLDKYGAGC